MDALVSAAILGVVEGITEFLPISSTAHLIIAGHFLGREAGGAFEVVIQLGAILAVCWEYRKRLAAAVAGAVGREPAARRFFGNLFIAFLPAAMVGALAHGFIKGELFAPLPAACALIGGGILILFVESPRYKKTPRILSVDEISPRTALLIGIAQTAALMPGVSRAAATIIGGMFAGLSRRAATEFSFFLAIPTMFAASVYDLYQSRPPAGAWAEIAVGFAVAFVGALFAIRALLRFVSAHDFKVFGWYRIVFGAAVFAVLY